MKYLRPTILFVASLLVLSCSNPKSSGYNYTPTVSQVLSEIHIGDSKEAVAGVLGRPAAIRTSLTANGATEIWAYRYGDLVAKIRGPGASFGYGFAQGMSGQTTDRVIYFTFLDGVVSEIDGI